MEPALITAIVSVIMAAGAALAARDARVRADRRDEAKTIAVTVDTTEQLVELVGNQLARAARDYDNLNTRLDKVEAQLKEERGKTRSLNMQLGKMRKRVTELEDFIHEQGWTPPEATDPLDIS
jgi:chromosome segregation ATPase